VPDGWIKVKGWFSPEPEQPRVTVEDVAMGPEGYFAQQEMRMRRGKVKPYTVHRSRRTYELHLQHVFGTEALNELEAEAISDWLDEQLESGAAPKSVRHRHGLLSSIVKHGHTICGAVIVMILSRVL
jgi:hypothetical protein